MDKPPIDLNLTCPFPIQNYPRVLLAHGGGGKLMHQLITDIFFAAFNQTNAPESHDAAVLGLGPNRLAFTTDSYVVRPIQFPGGDIGQLAIHGTVNDLAMSGARAEFLSAGFILEEGLPVATLWEIVQSMKTAAEAAGVRIVTGDTKVVDRGKADGMFINTSGIGELVTTRPIHPESVQPGDAILVNGDLARHGMAIMAVREGLEFESTITSDTRSVVREVMALIETGIEVHCLRDLTRGGLASTLNEIASVSELSVRIEESLVPVQEEVAAACEILGFDPLHVACEGRFAAFVKASDAERALDIMRRNGGEACAVQIGQVLSPTESRPHPRVYLKSRIGVDRILDMLSGEQLPRIC